MTPVDNRASREFFEELASQYDSNRNRDSLANARRALAYYLRKFSSARQRTFLEIGTGTGEMFALHAKDYESAFAFDIALNMVVVARSKAKDVGHFCVASAERLPFPDQAFDFTLCMDVLEHVNNPAEVLREIARTLAPGGVAFVTTPNPLWAPLLWLAERLGMKVPEGPHQFVFASPLANSAVRTFADVAVAYTGFLVYAPYGPLADPAITWQLSNVPVLSRLGSWQLVVLRRAMTTG